MTTFEIVIQRGAGDGIPIVTLETRADEFLPVRSEGQLALDMQALLACVQPIEYGTLLGKAVFRDEVRDAFSRALAHTRSAGDAQPMRVLLTVENRELRSLHWERLCVPVDGAWDFLSLNQQTPFSIYLTATTDRSFPPIGRRDLRALVLVAGTKDLTGDYSALADFDVAATAQTVVSAFRGEWGEIQSDLLANLPGAAGPPDFKTLCERLTASSYSLLHIVCHGQYNPANGEMRLCLPGDEGRAVPADQLIERFRRIQGTHGLPHFTFLMTCESANPQAEDAFGGLGQRMVRELGMPAVLAMTAPISIPTANALAGAYYGRLYAHGQPDLALSEALSGLMGQYDITVPAIFSRLGGRALFSESLDRPLTLAEVAYGLKQLSELAAERAPVLKAQIDSLAAHLAATGLGETARQEREDGLAKANQLTEEILDMSFPALALGQPVPAYDGRCPFSGLSAFGSENSPFFFGREALVNVLAGRLREHPFLAVLGASGSGKSSLVMAGLLPQIGAPDAPVFTPGSDPLARLEAALAGSSSSILVVDQFEELFTLCGSEETRRTFIARLLALTPVKRVIITMRADFLGECAPYKDLKQALQLHTELIAPMDAGELRRAIDQQAAAVGLRFEADLAQDIVDDVHGQPGGMPLSQHALLLLWQRRHGRWLRSDEYRAIGGVQQAIANTADEIYTGLGEPDRERMRAIFLRLTRLDEDSTPGVERRDTRRRVPLDELIPAGSQRQATLELVSRLANARLIATSPDPLTGQQQVEVAHEALIRYWPRLGEWLDENRAALRLGNGVSEAADEWAKAQRDENLLVHRGGRLEDAWALAQSGRYPFNQEEIDYLAACRDLRERDLRVEQQRRQAAELARAKAEEQARISLGRQLAAQAAEAAGIDQVRALLLAVKSLQTHPEVQAAIVLAEQIRLLASPLARLGGDPDTTYSQVAIHPNGSRVAVDNKQGVWIWDIQARKEINRCPSIVYNDPPVFSPDGRYLAAAQAKDVLILEIASARVTRLPVEIPQEYIKILDIAFSPDGERLFCNVGNQWLEAWDHANSRVTDKFPLQQGEDPSQERARFSPDGKYLITISQTRDGTARWNVIDVWDTAIGQRLTQDRFSPGRANILFSGDGQHAIVDSNDGFLLWRAGAGEKIVKFSIVTKELNAFALNQDGSRLATVDYEGSLSVWNTQTAARIATMNASLKNESVRVLVFNHDGSCLLSGGESALHRLWNPATGEELARVYSPHPVQAVGFCEGRKEILTVDHQNRIQVWGMPYPAGVEIASAPIAGSRLLDNRYFILDGRWAVFTGEQHVWKWDAEWKGETTGEETYMPVTIQAIAESASPIRSRGVDYALISPDYSRLLKADNHSACIYRLDSGEQIAELPGFIEYSRTIDNKYAKWSKDGRRIFSLVKGLQTAAWDAATGQPVFRIPTKIPGEDIVYTEKIVSMDVSPDDKRIATLNNDSRIKIWDAQTGSQVLEITAERQSDSLTYDASGRRLISWGFGETIEVWDALDGTRINRFAPEKGPAQAAKPILITPDGAGLVAGLQDGTVRVWDLASGVEIRKIVLDETANSIALSPDGDWLITASENKARVWNLHTGQKMAHLPHQGEVTSAEMSMDGNLVVTTSADGRAHMWLWKFADLIQLACRRLPRDLTRDEWLHYLGDQVEYEPTCPGLL